VVEHLRASATVSNFSSLKDLDPWMSVSFAQGASSLSFRTFCGSFGFDSTAKASDLEVAVLGRSLGF
jgi:hypothetical protein